MNIRSVGFGALFAALFVVMLSCGTQEAPPAPVVEIDSGFISGVRLEGDMIAFRGIPYAAPPVGPLRW